MRVAGCYNHHRPTAHEREKNATLKIEVHHYFHQVDPLGGEILQKLKELKEFMTQQFQNAQESMAAVSTDLETISAGLTADAELIENLKAQIAASMPEAEATAVNAQLDTIQARSRQIAAIFDPAVPPAEVPPTP